MNGWGPQIAAESFEPQALEGANRAMFAAMRGRHPSTSRAFQSEYRQCSCAAGAGYCNSALEPTAPLRVAAAQRQG